MIQQVGQQYTQKRANIISQGWQDQDFDGLRSSKDRDQGRAKLSEDQKQISSCEVGQVRGDSH